MYLGLLMVPFPHRVDQAGHQGFQKKGDKGPSDSEAEVGISMRGPVVKVQKQVSMGWSFTGWYNWSSAERAGRPLGQAEGEGLLLRAAALSACRAGPSWSHGPCLQMGRYFLPA